MLLGQHLGGGHQGTLTAGGDGGEQSGDRHHGLATAHIALHQAGHGLLTQQIRADFCQYSLLSCREGKGQ